MMFKTPNGEKMVLLALADYEALVAGNDTEDAAAIAAFDGPWRLLSAARIAA